MANLKEGGNLERGVPQCPREKRVSRRVVTGHSKYYRESEQVKTERVNQFHLCSKRKWLQLTQRASCPLHSPTSLRESQMKYFSEGPLQPAWCRAYISQPVRSHSHPSGLPVGSPLHPPRLGPTHHLQQNPFQSFFKSQLRKVSLIPNSSRYLVALQGVSLYVTSQIALITQYYNYLSITPLDWEVLNRKSAFCLHISTVQLATKLLDKCLLNWIACFCTELNLSSPDSTVAPEYFLWVHTIHMSLRGLVASSKGLRPRVTQKEEGVRYWWGFKHQMFSFLCKTVVLVQFNFAYF